MVVTLALYNPVNRHPFVNYDDDRYVTENAHVRAGLRWETVTWALTSTEEANWHPLTWISHAADCQFFGLNPAGHHFTSLLLHALNAVLIFLLLVYGTQRVGASLLVAALFAVHPINVESAAWIAERKNILCTFFFLLAIGAYGWYALKPSSRRYLIAAALFVLALMSKPMAITLPCVLLLLDYWPLGRFSNCRPSPPAFKPPQFTLGKLVLEKLPLLALSTASALITMRAQQAGGAVRSTLQFGLRVRVENAVVAYAMYLWKTIWPARLAPLYPHPGDSLPVWQIALATIVLIAISAMVRRFRSRGYPVTGWLWFLGTLVPVIGLVQVGDQAMADRYAYIPLIGIFTILAFGSAELVERLRLNPRIAAAIALCILALLSVLTCQQLTYWSSSYDLWSHTLSVTDRNFIAEDNLGGALLLLGRPNDAYPHFQNASQINPRDPMSHSNLGAYSQEHGQLQEAIRQYQITIALTSDAGLLASTHANLGAAYREGGDGVRAKQSYDEALRLNPNQFNAYLGLGQLSEQQGKLDDAAADYRQSVRLRPTGEGYMRLGHALAAMGQISAARAAYEDALKVQPDLSSAQQALDALSTAR